MTVFQELYKLYPEEDWNMTMLLRHPDITLDFIESDEKLKKHILEFQFNPNANKNIPQEEPLSIYDLSITNAIPENDDSFWFEYSRDTPLYFIYANPTAPWKIRGICINPTIDMEFIIKNLDNGLDWDLLSENDAITMEMITQNPQYPWNYKRISRNRNLTVKFVVDNYDKGFDFGAMCGFMPY
jgi:hypothetical protein